MLVSLWMLFLIPVACARKSTSLFHKPLALSKMLLNIFFFLHFHLILHSTNILSQSAQHWCGLRGRQHSELENLQQSMHLEVRNQYVQRWEESRPTSQHNSSTNKLRTVSLQPFRSWVTGYCFFFFLFNELTPFFLKHALKIVKAACVAYFCSSC